jgi:4-aminobutyrate aminotransferase-like enzyme
MLARCRGFADALSTDVNEPLLQLSSEQIIGFIAEAARRWTEPTLPARMHAAQALVERTGYSRAMVEHALDRLMTGITSEALRKTLEDELGSLAALEGFVERAGRPAAYFRPCGTVLIIASRSTIGVAIPPALYALATKNAVIVKDREDGLLRAFFATLAEEHPAFGQAASAQSWSSDRPVQFDADVVVAFGNDETLARIRADLPITTDFVGFGSSLSCGYLSRASLDDPTHLSALLESAANDIILYDAEGCMSLHLFFAEVGNAEEEARLAAVAESLAAHMDRAIREYGPSGHHAASQLRTAAVRSSAQFRAALGKTVEARVGDAVVFVDADLAPPLRPLTSLIVPVRRPNEILAYRARHGLRFEVLAYPAGHRLEPEQRDRLELARLTGAHRITTFGSMQNPALAGNHGGRARALDFVRFVTYESAAPSNSELECLRSAVPGPESLRLAAMLAAHEARGVTYLAEDFPIFWERAKGALVTDVDGNRYLDGTAAFGVAAVGHGNPQVVTAISRQAARLMHGMGDVHPSAVRARYLERLSARAPGDLTRCFLGANGADAIEFALKTAFLKTRRPGVLMFEGAYHGLSYGALEVAGIDRFRAPFLPQLRDRQTRLPYPTEAIGAQAGLDRIEQALRQDTTIGAILIEPIAGRAGTLLPAPGVLRGLRALADRYEAVLIFDEIYTGFGRTGFWFACEAESVVPDIICLGKAIAGGFPLSAAVGNEATFSAWPRSTGEAIHTATFLGNPMACAAGHAVLDVLEREQLVPRAAVLGEWLGRELAALALRIGPALKREVQVRGRGMMWALDLGDATLAVEATVRALHAGLILLPQGTRSTAIGLTPPLTITKPQLARAIELLEQIIH